ncbi:four-jointed box protein 1 [Saccoglossus kowalevskii]|uniref:Four-jointed box protein 1 n=2 Tax=Saccoglossus kowalevskii TaxID=10224 RepID=A0A1B1JCF2_SACKO|nr:PREDICTED: four-jointed box protein 1 [Saccoglossus kowalevskii]ANS11582.1 four-jointed box protein 1-like protein [Saccoglossus kowalevskii]
MRYMLLPVLRRITLFRTFVILTITTTLFIVLSRCLHRQILRPRKTFDFTVGITQSAITTPFVIDDESTQIVKAYETLLPVQAGSEAAWSVDSTLDLIFDPRSCDNQIGKETSVNTDKGRSVVINNLTVVKDGIYWSEELERLLPAGPSAEHIYNVSSRLQFNSNFTVTHMKERVCSHWASPENAQITMKDGSKWCARYKTPCFILGEVMAYYFSLLMCINHIPPVIVTKPNPTTPQWGLEAVKEYLNNHYWIPSGLVTLTKWIPELHATYVPNIMKTGDRFLHVDNPMFSGLTQQQFLDLMEYSDATILDYLLAETDRVLYAARHNFTDYDDNNMEIHNMFADGNGNHWFLDNEMAFFWGQAIQHPKYAPLIEMLKSVCIFKRRTVVMVTKLYHHKNVPHLLWEIVNEHLGGLDLVWSSQLPMTCRRYGKRYTIDWARTLTKRIGHVYTWITRCSTVGYKSLLQEIHSNHVITHKMGVLISDSN